MKKICFVIPRTYYLFNTNISDAKDKVGGTQTQTYILSTGLAEDENFDVHFLVADFGQKIFEERQGVKLHKSFKFSDNILKRTFRFFKILKKINAEIYIFQSADIGVAFAVFCLKFFLKKKTIYMIAADAETSKKRQKKYNGFLTAFAMQFVYKKADKITVQTRQQFSEFEKNRNRKPDALIKNIYLQKIPTQLNYTEKKVILWVGRLTEIKNPEILFILAKKYPQENFIMIAPVVLEKKSYGKIMQTKAKEIKNLQYIDYVKPNEIEKFYRKAKIYVLTSDLEGFSNTMSEAMMQECAVLSYNVNPDNILNEYRYGFCADKDLNRFYSDFEKLLNDAELRKQYGQNGAKYIRENHQKKVIIESFKQLLF